MKNKSKIIVTGSEGVLGKEISKYLEKTHKVLKLDLKFGNDLTNEKFVKEWFSKNHADHLINCFVTNDHIDKKRTSQTLFEYDLESFKNSVNVNIVSLFSVCREFAKNNKKGTIVNFSSIYGIQSPRPDMYENSHKEIGYCVSKAGVINLSKYLATHFAPNIRVNCIVPGGVLHNQNSKFVKNYSKLTPLQRMMKKNELNGLIDFLCSQKSTYMTGSTIVVDGGYSIW
jgi:NAD(P)-dependent dehydrogenase (short-subunit alcohol dehydrogenase family)